MKRPTPTTPQSRNQSMSTSEPSLEASSSSNAKKQHQSSQSQRGRNKYFRVALSALVLAMALRAVVESTHINGTNEKRTYEVGNKGLNDSSSSGPSNSALRTANIPTPLPQTDSQKSTEPPSFLKEAFDACSAARSNHGTYPSIYEQIVKSRVPLVYDDARKDHRYNFLAMINDKFGGYLYATKLGVRTPRVLFCGQAKDIPSSMELFGANYVIKPLWGHSAKGVKVVKNGVDILSKNNASVSYERLSEEYREDETESIVEELIESALPSYDGVIPPDYKFFSYGGVSELMWYVDRNNGQTCKDYFDVSPRGWSLEKYRQNQKFAKMPVASSKWRLIKDFYSHTRRMPQCHPDKRKAIYDPVRQSAMEDAVQTLANNLGPNWIRIDMYDSKNGPVLGEFTPFSSSGHAIPLVGCVMSYLFIAHAERQAPNADNSLIDILRNDVRTFKDVVGVKNHTANAIESRNEFHFYPLEEWMSYDEMTKCSKVMEAQSDVFGATQKEQ